jgi:tRNA-splicing ligase RtcB
MEEQIERRGPGPPKEIKQISEVVWELPASYKKGMRVPARIYATKKLLDAMDPGVFEQVTNVATLPGIVKYAYCMPDGHWGYGFPIGGVAAFDQEKGVISPGGIGFDINCGMRFVSTNLTIKDVKPKLKELVDILFKTVPAGVGAEGFVKVNRGQFDELMVEGAKWVIDNGYGWSEDTERMEEDGCIKGADPSKVSDKARSRGITQIGTLGSGNHYLEIQHAEKIFLPDVAKAFHIDKEGCIGIMIHCGSRGFGHQIGTDYLRVFEPAMKKYKIEVPDRELACAPFSSKEGQDYYHAMACAANMAFANRQVILHRVREAFSKVFKQPAEKLGMHLVYDVAHNIAKLEKHDVDGKQVELIVHRKGSTRCMGPGRPETPSVYKKVGQPVIVGGSMETGSFLCVGTDQAARETWGSTMHGSGRTMSRTAARQQMRGDMLQKDMEKHGIVVKAVSMSGLAEEAGVAYKDINEVVETMEIAGVSRKVVQLRPLGNVKG